ncbi:MAG: recombinase RecA [Candidatus Caldatribacterium sp.]|uniref:recombinase RecA n=1 Tax=Candidatus Caldatribacterium sp. TaxID=2282143 RepID=UPI0029973E4A|nr:recombinase RecA [Candidatus Caldatribacterium sp.]MCX7731114.1 recombinase RecA [Candidatus Caldatribacterium sp.]MDW8081453.1 recombinase RecA [Candidatus Calescibacterium sp.]
MSEERLESIKQAMNIIERKYGKGAIMFLSQNVLTADIEVIKTGSILLNIALGVGGFPRGRVVEVFGPEASGKTTIALHAIAEAQKKGGIAAFVDAEHALDPTYASRIGVQMDRLLLSQPTTAEEALDIVDTLVRSGSIDIVVLDSVAALAPRMELEGSIGEPMVGLQARLMSQALRRLTGYISKTKTVAIFVNQLREKIGMNYGPSETTPGGRALKFYASVRLDVRRKDYIRVGGSEQIVGAWTKVRVVKNKLAAPFKEADLELFYGEGISKEGEIIDLGESAGVIRRSGNWYSFGEYRLGQGREGSRQFLKENPDIAQRILLAALEKMGIDPKIALND